jgi:hypothetical protein
VHGSAHNGPDGRVHARTVTAAGEHGEPPEPALAGSRLYDKMLAAHRTAPSRMSPVNAVIVAAGSGMPHPLRASAVARAGRVSRLDLMFCNITM